MSVGCAPRPCSPTFSLVHTAHVVIIIIRTVGRADRCDACWSTVNTRRNLRVQSDHTMLHTKPWTPTVSWIVIKLMISKHVFWLLISCARQKAQNNIIFNWLYLVRRTADSFRNRFQAPLSYARCEGRADGSTATEKWEYSLWNRSRETSVRLNFVCPSWNRSRETSVRLNFVCPFWNRSRET